MKYYFFYVSLILLYWICGGTIYAADFQSARLLGLAGAGHAHPGLVDGLYMNPGFMSLQPFQAVSANYLLKNPDGIFQKASTGMQKQNLVQVAIADGLKESFLQGGISYVYLDTHHAVHVGISKKIADRFGVGVTAKAFWIQSSTDYIKTVDLLGSVTYVVSDWVVVSITGDNMLLSNKSLGLERTVIVGTKLVVGSKVAFFVDPSYTFARESFTDALGAKAGLEVMLLKDFIFRAGYMYRGDLGVQWRGVQALGLGVSWSSQRFVVDVGVLASDMGLTFTAGQVGATIYF